MSLLKQTKDICRLYNIYLQKTKGQNFLINENIYQEIIDLSKIENSQVLEVGPGLGFLSVALAKVAKKVLSIEIDEKVFKYLQTTSLTKDLDNLEIINEDILKLNVLDYFSPQSGYRVVANLPYNITSIFLRTFLSHPFPPQSLFLMLQKEVAERIVAQSPYMNLLAFSVQYFAEPKVIKIVKAENFWPQPQVDSALIEINYKTKRLKNSLVSSKQLEYDKKIFQLVKMGFSAKRKMLKNNLSAGLNIKETKIREFLKKASLKESCRAQNLSVDDWKSLNTIIFGLE
jgi:16S rRNA (adenine1518-N6/adenine1519-N6)-dimethyltransferase